MVSSLSFIIIVIFLILFIILNFLNINSKILQLRKESFLEYGMPQYRDFKFDLVPSPSCGPCRRCPPSFPLKVCKKIDMDIYMAIKDKTICPKLVMSEWIDKNNYNQLKIASKELKKTMDTNNIYISNINDAKVNAIAHSLDAKNANSSLQAEKKIILTNNEVKIAETQFKNVKNEYDTFIKKGKRILNIGEKCFSKDDYNKIFNKLQKDYNSAIHSLNQTKDANNKTLEYLNKVRKDESDRLERKRKEKERLEREKREEEERQRKQKERLERERKAKEERDKKTKWMREITHHYYVAEGITNTPLHSNSRIISNQSLKASSNNHSLTYNTGEILASPNKVNGKNLYYINQPCTSWNTGTMLSFGNSTQVSTYHIMFLITRDATKKVNWRDNPSKRAEFVYTQTYANVTNGKFTNLERGKYLPYGGLSLGRYPYRSSKYMRKTSVYPSETIDDFTGYHLSLHPHFYKSKRGKPSQQSWYSFSSMTSRTDYPYSLTPGMLGTKYGYSHLSCICLKLDKNAPPNLSAGHFKVYSHQGGGVNDLVESPKVEWVRGMHHVINTIVIGNYIGGYVAGMWVPSCPDNVQIYEIVIKKDGVLNDIDEKLCAESLLKKWLPYLGNK